LMMISVTIIHKNKNSTTS
ncbi:hypothetical protein BS596_01410, partial [Klebsiella pneumoniae]